MTVLYDVVVIGGGIHGVGVAQAAAVGGYTVLLLEQHALAAGTSSRSSKLIHGGLRYLETGQFRLVRESLQEREILLAIAPDLVERKDFYIPLYQESQRTPWQVAAGLTMYHALAGRAGAFSYLPRRRWDTLEGLRTTHLRAVFQYTDAQTDDAALTRAVAASAEHFGAEIRLEARFIRAESQSYGYEVHFVTGGVVQRCRARVLINAAGPWVGHVLSLILPGPPRLAYDLVQGAHIVTAGPARAGIYYTESPTDRRPVFVMPWQGRTLTGTTETLVTGDLTQVTPRLTEMAYLQEALASIFPQASTEVLASFAGVRVLPRSGVGVNARARDTILMVDRPHPRLISIYGGKLTGYRLTAERVLARCRSVLPSRTPYANTRRLILKA